MAVPDPYDAWEPAAWSVDLVVVDGPVRVYDDSPEPPAPRRPFGFRPPALEVDPILWEGDSA